MHLCAWAWSEPHRGSDVAGANAGDPQGVSLCTFWRKQAHRIESIVGSVSKPRSPFADTAGKSLAPIPESEAELEEEEEEEEKEEEAEEQEREQEKENINDKEEAETIINQVKGEQREERENATIASARTVDSAEFNRTTANTTIIGIKIPIKKALSEQENSVKNKATAEAVAPPQAQHTKGLSEKDPNGWQSIPKPKGHSALDYARWDRVEDDSSEDDDDDDDDEEAQPQYRFRLKTVGVRPVKWRANIDRTWYGLCILIFDLPRENSKIILNL